MSSILGVIFEPVKHCLCSGFTLEPNVYTTRIVFFFQKRYKIYRKTIFFSHFMVVYSHFYPGGEISCIWSHISSEHALKISC